MQFDLSQFPSYDTALLRVKNPHFDRKQSIYLLLRSRENPSQKLSKIIGLTLRELLNRRDTLFVNGQPRYIVQLVGGDMEQGTESVIKGTDYSAAEQAFKRASLPPIHPPPPISNRDGSNLPPPRPREVKRDLLLGVTVLFLFVLVGMLCFHRELFRAWRVPL